MKQLTGYIIATIQTHLDYLKERERTGLTPWAEEQKRRRASLEGRSNVGVDEPG